jgi:hypothetical protein
MACMAQEIARAGFGILSKNIGKLGMLVPGRKSSTVYILSWKLSVTKNDPGSAYRVSGQKKRIGGNYRAYLKCRYSCPEEDGG